MENEILIQKLKQVEFEINQVSNAYLALEDKFKELKGQRELLLNLIKELMDFII